ncbi:MAG: Acetyl-coenzyme A carboxylase carboxyl transferase subunit alpha [Alphaproteobacteria bacterium MarineAlpha9_Bin2]|nr:MAG: Acetyl-coenzyme A carboxylase carboxyl transferase subunit alpha [Alphaproteobacteria bacterium MarineAlpha9_Bin2]
MQFLNFEKHIADLEGKVKELTGLDLVGEKSENNDNEISKLKEKIGGLIKKTYEKLSPWQITLVARHPERPHFIDYLDILVSDFQILSGDRSFSEDRAVIAGIGTFHSRSVMIIGQEKGFDTDSRLKHNFGMVKPEGYRKIARLLKLADKFGLPIITFVDTAGAYPGIGAEERGQAEAIAQCIKTSLEVKVPFISVIIGEGGSGGALALATSDKVLMLQNSIYSVISPEGCASILWRDNDKAEEAAESLGLTANFLKNKGVIDTIIAEPTGGAHRDHHSTIRNVYDAILQELNELINISPDDLLLKRQEKFLRYGRI